MLQSFTDEMKRLKENIVTLQSENTQLKEENDGLRKLREENESLKKKVVFFEDKLKSIDKGWACLLTFQQNNENYIRREMQCTPRLSQQNLPKMPSNAIIGLSVCQIETRWWLVVENGATSDRLAWRGKCLLRQKFYTRISWSPLSKSRSKSFKSAHA